MRHNFICLNENLKFVYFFKWMFMLSNKAKKGGSGGSGSGNLGLLIGGSWVQALQVTSIGSLGKTLNPMAHMSQPLCAVSVLISVRKWEGCHWKSIE